MSNFIIYSNTSAKILYVKGNSNLVLRLEIFKKTISILMILAAVPYGVLAICIARAFYTQIAMVINTYYTGKLFDLGYGKQVKDFYKYLIYSIISVIPTFILTYTTLPSFVQLMLGGFIAVGIYFYFLRKDHIFREWCKLFCRKSC